MTNGFVASRFSVAPTRHQQLVNSVRRCAHTGSSRSRKNSGVSACATGPLSLSRLLLPARTKFEGWQNLEKENVEKAGGAICTFQGVWSGLVRPKQAPQRRHQPTSGANPAEVCSAVPPSSRTLKIQPARTLAQSITRHIRTSQSPGPGINSATTSSSSDWPTFGSLLLGFHHPAFS